jgi:hypothetical protein
MASQPTSSPTPPEDTSLFCCNNIFNEISNYSATLYLSPGEIPIRGAVPRSSNRPIPRTDISSTDTDNALSKSQRIIQVLGPIHINYGLGEGPLVMDAEVELHSALTRPTSLEVQYFAGILAEGRSEIEKWEKLEISDDILISRGLNKYPPGTTRICRLGCSEHKQSFMVNVWWRKILRFRTNWRGAWSGQHWEA